MKKDVVIYTAISKGYDDLKIPYSVSDRCDYVCFTDDPSLHGGPWDVRPFPNEDQRLDQIRKCRQVKIQPHVFLPEYQYSIWVDGNIEITADIDELIEKHFDQPGPGFLSFDHPWRDCIYVEAEGVIENKKGIEIGYGDRRVRDQMAKYRAEGMPEKNGLIESNVIMRKHTPEVKKVMDQWWQEVKTHSRRDQLSFNYVAWKNNFSYGHLEGCSRWNTNKYFEIKYEHSAAPTTANDTTFAEEQF
ncbi:glycosyltransferase domain-containing protein [Oceanobacillus massiliensis]|uniref:glycosyltransferase domain-containing protein n=1 Tax=Oceanobacillus massiliensis TaxID=1465765 RepID=UPI0030164D7F